MLWLRELQGICQRGHPTRGTELCNDPNPRMLTETRTTHQPLTQFPSDHAARRATGQRTTVGATGHRNPQGPTPNRRPSNRRERAAEVYLLDRSETGEKFNRRAASSSAPP